MSADNLKLLIAASSCKSPIIKVRCFFQIDRKSQTNLRLEKMNNYSAIVEDKFKMTRSTARVNVLLDQYEVE